MCAPPSLSYRPKENTHLSCRLMGAGIARRLAPVCKEHRDSLKLYLHDE